MDIRHIRYLVSAVESGSLSSAAKAQFVTVQAVSKAISELENELGTTLLTRTNYGVAPTVVGAAIYQRARGVLNSFDDLVEFSSSFSNNQPAGRLSIALCAPHFSNDTVALANFSKLIERASGLKTLIISGTGEQCLEALNSHAVDAMATIGSYSNPLTDIAVIGSLPPGVVLASNHPLASRTAIRFEDMTAYPVLASEKWDTFNRSILCTCQDLGMSSRVITYHAGIDIDDFFQKDFGMMFSVHVPSITLDSSSTVNIPIHSDDCASVPLCLVSLKSHKSPAFLQLERCIGDIFRSGKII